MARFSPHQADYFLITGTHNKGRALRRKKKDPEVLIGTLRENRVQKIASCNGD
jgi:hypothetical protein